MSQPPETRAPGLAAVLAHPHEEEPRLRYAHWLEEAGDPRGELIRVQCRLGQLFPGHPEELELLARQRDLLLQIRHGGDLGRELVRVQGELEQVAQLRRRQPIPVAEELLLALEQRQRPLLERRDELWRCIQREEERRAGLPSLPGVMWLTHRGLLGGAVQTTAAIFLSQADTLFRVAPLEVVTLVEEESGQADPEQFGACPWLERLSALILGGPAADAFAAALAASPHLPCLTKLTIGGGLSDGGVQALANSPNLGRLTHLCLSYNRDKFSAAGAAALAASPHLSVLRSLHLAQSRIGGAGAAALAASSHLRSLVTLNLRDCDVGEEGAQVLARSDLLGQLLALHLGWNSLDAGAVAQLAASPQAARLLTLYLPGNAYGDEGVTALASSPCLARLQRLHLRDSGVGDAGLKALAKGALAQGLVQLNLFDNTEVGDAGLQALAMSRRLRQMRELVLDCYAREGWRSRVTDAGVGALVKSRRLQQLRRARVSMQRVTAGMKRLFQERFTRELYPGAHA
jgi:uncharacterized protein (TIGR02996 family)